MAKELNTFDKRATEVKTLVTEFKGKAPESEESFKSETNKTEIKSKGALRENILLDMKSAVKQIDSLRAGSKDRKAIDISFAEFVKEKWGFAPDDDGQPNSFYHTLGINPSQHTMDSLMTMPDFDDGMRWIIPEIIREAVRGGLRRAPIYPNLIAAEETVSQPTVIMPHINMSDAMPKRIGEAETIPTGTVSFGQKSVSLQKIGTGIKITDEVQQFVPINVLGIYLEDVGVKLNLALDTMMIDVLINGDGSSQSAAPVVGVNTPGQWSYIDLLKAWIRMGLLGRMPQGILSNENPALDILMLPEFKGYGTGIGAVAANQLTPNMKLRTPVPTSQNYDIHGAMPSEDQIMLIDNATSLIKLNASALRVETDRIVERQVSGTYVSMVTGFAKLFQDGAVILDNTLDIATNGFPQWMNPRGVQTQSFK